jgi:predicted nucleotidyltransferase
MIGVSESMNENQPVEISPEIKSASKEAIDNFKTKYGYEILFTNISGAHLFGTASIKSDIDLRGCFIVPTLKLLKFSKPRDTIELSKGDVEIQIHEAEKFLSLMIKGNMNFIEEVLSPLRIVDTIIAEEFRKLANLSLSKETFNHVQGMSIHTKKHALKENFTNPKRNLYLLRELLRGIVLFRDGIFESNTTKLAGYYGDSSIIELTQELIRHKNEGLDYNEPKNFKELIGNLETEMLRAKEFGTLRARPPDDIKADAEKLLIKLRLGRVDIPKK